METNKNQYHQCKKAIFKFVVCNVSIRCFIVDYSNGSVISWQKAGKYVVGSGLISISLALLITWRRMYWNWSWKRCKLKWRLHVPWCWCHCLSSVLEEHWTCEFSCLWPRVIQTEIEIISRNCFSDCDGWFGFTAAYVKVSAQIGRGTTADVEVYYWLGSHTWWTCNCFRRLRVRGARRKGTYIGDLVINAQRNHETVPLCYHRSPHIWQHKISLHKHSVTGPSASPTLRRVPKFLTARYTQSIRQNPLYKPSSASIPWTNTPGPKQIILFTIQQWANECIKVTVVQ